MNDLLVRESTVLLSRYTSVYPYDEFFEFDHATCYPKPVAPPPRVVLAMPTTTDIDEVRDMLSVCADRLALTCA
jgi:hypothetical protein